MPTKMKLKRDWKDICLDHLMKAHNIALGDPVDMFEKKNRKRRMEVAFVVGKVIGLLTNYTAEDMQEVIKKQGNSMQKEE